MIKIRRPDNVRTMVSVLARFRTRQPSQIAPIYQIQTAPVRSSEVKGGDVREYCSLHRAYALHPFAGPSGTDESCSRARIRETRPNSLRFPMRLGGRFDG